MYRNLFFLLIAALSLQSCLNVQDEIWIEADGSGRYESATDLSNLYPFIMMGINEEKPEDGEEADPFTQWLKTSLQEGKVDTMLNFRGMMETAMQEQMPGMSYDQMINFLENEPLPDDMTEQERETVLSLLETVGQMQMRMQVDPDKSMLKTTNITTFGGVDELQNMSQMMDVIMQLAQMGESGPNPLEDPQTQAMLDQLGNAQTALDINKGVLRIRRAGMDLSMMGDELKEMMPMMKMFLGDQPYRLTIHLPGKVKKISSDVVTKIDRNTVQLEIPLDDLFDPETLIDVEVKFKGMR